MALPNGNPSDPGATNPYFQDNNFAKGVEMRNNNELLWENLEYLDTGENITDASAATPADADEFGFWQIVGLTLKKITWANIKATLKTYFDTLYPTIAQVTKTYITAQATPTRVTSAAPDAIGEYRSYLRDAGARTYTETNGTPGTAPSSSNGYRMYIPTNYATADASGEPSRYEIYIGLNKEPIFEFYSSTGRTGLIFTKPFQRWGGFDVNGGIETHYDPTAGIARVIHQPYNGGSNYTGLDFSGELVTADIYFDIKC